MKKLIEQILTDREVRNEAAMKAYAVNTADVGTPWQSEE